MCSEVGRRLLCGYIPENQLLQHTYMGESPYDARVLTTKLVLQTIDIFLKLKSDLTSFNEKLISKYEYIQIAGNLRNDLSRINKIAKKSPYIRLFITAKIF